MKKSRCTPDQVAFSLRHTEGGAPVSEVCRKMGVPPRSPRRKSKMGRCPHSRGDEPCKE